MTGIRVEVDWDKDGTFSAVGADVTPLVRPNQGVVSVQYGRDQSTALAPTVSGQGQIVLDNRDQRFSPRNPGSPLYGKIKPARPVRITRTIAGVPVGVGFPGGELEPEPDLFPSPGGAELIEATYTLFVGHTDDSPINPDLGSRSVSLSLLDWLADFRGQTITTQLHRDIRTGTAIGLVLDAFGWPDDLRDLDLGATVIPWWWEDGTDALAALEKIIQAEGPPALISVGSGGEIVFRDRHHRITRPKSVTSQGVWRAAAGVEPVMSVPFTYDEAWRNIINSTSVAVDVRRPQEMQVVWESEDAVTLAPGEQKLITATASDPFYNAITPIEGIDFRAITGSVTTELITRSGISVAIRLTAVGAAASISNLRLRAQPVTVSYTVRVSASDAVSVAEYGPRGMPGDLSWCGVGDAQSVISQAVSQRAHPLPVVQARFVLGGNPARSGLILPRDLSDRVTVIEPQTALSADFFIESIQHELTGDHDHAVTVGLEYAPAEVASAFRFDTAGQGFDDGRFGSGVDSAFGLFRFDGVVGERFNQGVFAH